MKNNKVGLYYAIMIVLLVLISVSAFFFNYFFDMRNEDLSLENKNITESNKMGYNVKSFDDDFVKTNQDDNNYVFSLIDNIDTYFNVTTSFSSPVEGQYSYFVTGYVNLKQGEEILKNEVYKSDENKFLLNGSAINISDSFDVDVDNVMTSFKGQINNLSSDAIGSIEYDVTYNYSVYSDSLGKTLANSKTLTIDIPISAMTNISVTKDDETTKTDYSDVNHDDNKIYLIICLEFLGAIIIFVLLIVLIVKRINGQVSSYEAKLDKVLKKYEKHLIHLKEIPDLTTYSILFVESIDDLKEVSDRVNSPISYIEIVEKCESTFMVIEKSKAYVYKLNNKSA